MIQLDLFAEPPPPPPPRLDDDPLVAKLLAAGIGGNAWLLCNNRTLGGWDQAPGNPSRLFKFPIEFIEPGRVDGRAALALNHPLIGSHPLVERVQNVVGHSIEWIPEDEFGRDRGAKWRFFHSVDLFSADHYQLLLDSPEFTDADSVASGAGYALRYNKISPGRARTIMLAFGIEEPGDRSAAALDAGIIRPDPMWMDDNGKPTKTPRFGMNQGGRCSEDSIAWAFLHGIEDGWFKHDRSNHLTMTPAGLDRLGVDISKGDPHA